ncbi:hypothetical protein DTO021D3_6634 [Paecilomyces variotii]|nr:hypothetical protein DTO032I3_6119 [Paecilomyces variotii]KAJ9276567.1 hypothetical protein DTO021D3_6634 [Paecilomyces variotii]KAJ9345053.1 hypothetical protein DTO027B6_2198 [Paecilomyces variotii]KAJ9352988.1 hypothetical protein DTO027B9_5493 [Paecilomyces variotii]KAJ9390197.1 hypothetical protein DTO032I4_1723 [Paecilomyces variotii]
MHGVVQLSVSGSRSVAAPDSSYYQAARPRPPRITDRLTKRDDHDTHCGVDLVQYRPLSIQVVQQTTIPRIAV